MGLISSLAKNGRALGTDPYPYIRHVLCGNASSGLELEATGFRRAAAVESQSVLASYVVFVFGYE
jgi:hypothetical protein